MATKNLARNVTQGGHTAYWQYTSRARTRANRHAVKVSLAQARSEGDTQDVAPVQRKRPRTDKNNDHLRYIKVWLDAQVGRAWDDVWSALVRRYDRRRLCNWHLIDTHLRHEILQTPDEQGYGRFVVDWDGVLRREEDFEVTRTSPRMRPEAPQNWPTHDMLSAWDDPDKLLGLSYIVTRGGIHFWVRSAQGIYYAPDRLLSQEELIYLHALPSWQRKSLRFSRAKVDRCFYNRYVAAKRALPHLPMPVLINQQQAQAV